MDKVEREELPPPEYGDLLLQALREVSHVFETARACGMSFGIAKFQLAQQRVERVGEYVGRDDCSPNPEIILDIRKCPPINKLMDLQASLGAANCARAHSGPAHVQNTTVLRPMLKPDAAFPPNAEQLAAIEAVKELLFEDHTIAVPDKAAALTAANVWLANEPPTGRPSEMDAGTFGYAIGASTDQCDAGAAVLLGACRHASRIVTPLSNNLGIALRAAGLLEAPREHSSDPAHAPCEYHARRHPGPLSHYRRFACGPRRDQSSS